MKTAYILCGGAFLSTVLVASSGKAWTYFIDETTDYTNNGWCANMPDLNVVTASLQTTLNADGRTGFRYVNGSAWPSDFWEACSATYAPENGGDDWAEADNALLTVFAGHGEAQNLWFGFPGATNFCNSHLSVNMRLGSMWGAKSGFAIYLACDVLSSPYGIGGANMQWLKQQFGWSNSIAIGANELRDFYNNTSYGYGVPNSTAWLDQMDGGGRHPVVITTGPNATSCWSSHASYKLAGSIGTDPKGSGPSCEKGQPVFYYCMETR